MIFLCVLNEGRGEERRVERRKRRRKEPEYAKYKGGKRKFMVPLYFPASLKRGLGCFCCGSVVRTESPTPPFSQVSQKEKQGEKKKTIYSRLHSFAFYLLNKTALLCQ